jgi:hypothetical protein
MATDRDADERRRSTTVGVRRVPTAQRWDGSALVAALAQAVIDGATQMTDEDPATNGTVCDVNSERADCQLTSGATSSRRFPMTVIHGGRP